ncbi:MAG: hypothetical protein HY720_06995 [Planctomycetes bacterium]|nr:hypothetical protein [Planctomycetota bacterium]
MIRRARHVRLVQELLRHSPVVAILGARPVGKTTLARQLVAARRSASAWFDLEDPADVARLAEPGLALGPLTTRKNCGRSPLSIADHPGGFRSGWRGEGDLLPAGAASPCPRSSHPSILLSHMNPNQTGGAIVPKLVYPSSDGEPMADNDSNRERMVNSASALREAFRRRGEMAYASTDLFVYPIEGEPWTRNAPDVLVAPGCEQKLRESFKYWEEPGTVQFAGEFLSVRKRETFESDEIQERIEFYRTKLATRELFIYQPLDIAIDSGFHFHFLRIGGDGRYHEVRPNSDGWFASEVLALEIRPADGGIEFRDPASGEVYLSAESRAEREVERAERAEQRVAELERELERLRKRESPE